MARARRCGEGPVRVGQGLAWAHSGPDGDQSTRSMTRCAQQRKASDTELTWARRSSTCLTVGVLAWRQHGVTGRAPRRS
jgi:hypothetical protein